MKLTIPIALLSLICLSCTGGDAGDTTNRVACGGTSCDTKAGQVCCVGQTSFSCTTASSCTGTALPCDGPEDCSGGQCCLDLNNKFFCAASCDSTKGQVTICHSLHDCGGGSNICAAKSFMNSQASIVIGQCDQVTCGDMSCDTSKCPPDQPCTL